MRQKSVLLLGCLVLMMSTLPEANAGKYGMAGCGVGAMIFMDQPGKIQIVSATTNYYFVQSSSISSGTSNCTEDAHEQASLFIAVNHESLKKDISRGSGEALDGLAQIYGCGDAKTLGQTLQKEYGTIYPTDRPNADDVRAKIESAVRENKSLAASCRVVS